MTRDCQPDGSHCDRCGFRAYRCGEAVLEAIRANDPAFAAYLSGERPEAAHGDSEGVSEDA